MGGGRLFSQKGRSGTLNRKIKESGRRTWLAKEIDKKVRAFGRKQLVQQEPCAVSKQHISALSCRRPDSQKGMKKHRCGKLPKRAEGGTLILRTRTAIRG